MPTVRQLDAVTTITLGLMGDSKIAKRDYPENEWGVTLKHYDTYVEWFSVARLETKEESIRRDAVNQMYPAAEDKGSWTGWHDNNPKLPSIPYHESTYEAMKRALEFFKSPPKPIRDCLVHLAEGNDLHPDDLFVFLQLYAEFIAAIEVLYSYDPYADQLKNQRKAWNKTNKERWQHHAAVEIMKVIEKRKTGIEQARNSFAADVADVIEGKRPPPDGWAVEEYKEFLGKADHIGRRLKKNYGQNLTLSKIKSLIKDEP